MVTNCGIFMNSKVCGKMETSAKPGQKQICISFEGFFLIRTHYNNFKGKTILLTYTLERNHKVGIFHNCLINVQYFNFVAVIT